MSFLHAIFEVRELKNEIKNLQATIDELTIKANRSEDYDEAMVSFLNLINKTKEKIEKYKDDKENKDLYEVKLRYLQTGYKIITLHLELKSNFRNLK